MSSRQVALRLLGCVVLSLPPADDPDETAERRAVDRPR